MDWKLSSDYILLLSSKYPANSLQTICKIPTNNLQLTTCYQIWQISLCNSVFVSSFRRIFVRTNLFFSHNELFLLSIQKWHSFKFPTCFIVTLFFYFLIFVTIYVHEVKREKRRELIIGLKTKSLRG